MNAYFCDAGERDSLAEYVNGYPRYERLRVFALAFAETRNRAKALFSRSALDRVPYTEIRTRTVARNVDRPLTLAHPHDPLWEQVDWCCLEETPAEAVQP